MKYLLTTLLAASAALPRGSLAQLSYRAGADTVTYESVNVYRMYFVRGADTLGEPQSSRTLERHVLRRDGDRLQLTVALEGIDSPFQVETPFEITPAGRVLRVGGRPVAEVAGAQVDVLPRLPATAATLAPGLQWKDTVSAAHAQPYGETYYRVRREYQLHRVVDTLSTQLAFITATGEMALRQGGWQDSTAGVVWWQEVRGPIADTLWFDVRRGSVHTSVAHMSLVGSGGAGPRGAGVTMPSGLSSLVRRTRR